MFIEMWSDIACPFCYLGLRRLQAAIDSVEGGAKPDLKFRSFELAPNSPPRRDGNVEEHLSRKYGVPIEQARAMNAGLRAQGEELGLDLRFDRIVLVNTFDAHRLLHLAQQERLGNAMKERLLAAYFTRGEDLSSHETLLEIAVEIGLDPSVADDVLAGDAFGDAVRRDEAAATDLGITGVPYFLINGAVAVAGAQPVEVFERALRRGQEVRARSH